MRLSSEQIAKIHAVVERELSGERYSVGLFGSRLNDKARGGDVDLVITTQQELTLRTKAKLKLALEQEVMLPFDIVYYVPTLLTATPFQRLAFEGSTPLCSGPQK